MSIVGRFVRLLCDKSNSAIEWTSFNATGSASIKKFEDKLRQVNVPVNFPIICWIFPSVIDNDKKFWKNGAPTSSLFNVAFLMWIAVCPFVPVKKKTNFNIISIQKVM